MAVTLKIDTEPAQDASSLVSVFNRFTGSVVVINTPGRTAEGLILGVGWNQKTQTHGFFLGDSETLDMTAPAKEFVPFDHNDMEVTYL